MEDLNRKTHIDRAVKQILTLETYKATREITFGVQGRGFRIRSRRYGSTGRPCQGLLSVRQRWLA
jgi:hypothetical protein